MSANPEAATHRPVDILVAGAGPAGSVAALELARAGKSVLLADRLRPTAPKLGETLPGAAIRLLHLLDLGSIARVGDDTGHCHIGGTLTAWNIAALVPSDAIVDPYGAGIRLDRRNFDMALRHASGKAGAAFRRSDVISLARTAFGWNVGFDDGSSCSARWIVDATGRGGKLARLMGLPRKRQRALVAVYGLGRPERNIGLDRTLIEATREGWFYAGRLNDARWAFGFHTTPEQATALRQDPARWLALADDAPQLTALLGKSAFEGELIFRDARDGGLTSVAGANWVACGDAALCFDPIAGQGLFGALRTGMGAARHILSDGAGQATSGYVAELANAASIYRDRRRALYAAQSRWSDAPFWRAQADGLVA